MKREECLRRAVEYGQLLRRRLTVSTFTDRTAAESVPEQCASEEHGAPRYERQVAMNIYVGNLPFDTTDGDLRTLFADYGAITSASVITDRDTGRSRGFGFVELADATLAEKAVGNLDGHDFNGRRLTVNQARPRASRS
jgi:RNA recognition motif-containing protein